MEEMREGLRKGGENHTKHNPRAPLQTHIYVQYSTVYT